MDIKVYTLHGVIRLSSIKTMTTEKELKEIHKLLVTHLLETMCPKESEQIHLLLDQITYQLSQIHQHHDRPEATADPPASQPASHEETA